MNWEHTFSQVNFFSILQRKGDYNRPSDYCFISVTPSDVISWILHNSGQHWGSWEYLQVVKHRKSVTPLWDWTLDITFLTQTKYPVKGVFWRVLNWLQYVIQSVDLTVSASFLSPSRTPKVNIVLPLSSAWKDKADKRWSHVSTSHNRRNRGRSTSSCGSRLQAETLSNVFFSFLRAITVTTSSLSRIRMRLYMTDVPITVRLCVFSYLMSFWPTVCQHAATTSCLSPVWLFWFPLCSCFELIVSCTNQ